MSNPDNDTAGKKFSKFEEKYGNPALWICIRDCSHARTLYTQWCLSQANAKQDFVAASILLVLGVIMFIVYLLSGNFLFGSVLLILGSDALSKQGELLTQKADMLLEFLLLYSGPFYLAQEQKDDDTEASMTES